MEVIRLLTLAILSLGVSTITARGSAETEGVQVDDDYGRGHGSVSLGMQAFHVERLNLNGAERKFGDVDTQVAYISIEYAITERWLMSAGIPWVRRRYVGPFPHDPLKLNPPHPEAPFVDDGEYHSGFQDWVLGAKYLLRTGTLLIEPLVELHLPSHDYPFFAHSAIGQNLWKVELGAELTHLLPLSDWYYRIDARYVVVEQTLGFNVNHFKLYTEVGYFLTPDLALNFFVQAKRGRGYAPVTSTTDDRWYQHDRTLRHNYVNVGAGGDWFFAERHQLDVQVFTNVWGEDVHLVDWGLNLGITRYF